LTLARLSISACPLTALKDSLKRDLVAPPLILSESLSALHEMRWREQIPDDMAALGLQRQREMPIRIEHPDNLSDEAWCIADADSGTHEG